MAVISIVGNIDKRILAYPIIKAVGLEGRTIVITDDGAYGRLIDEGERFGTCDNVDIMLHGWMKPLPELIEPHEEAPESEWEAFEELKEKRIEIIKRKDAEVPTDSQYRNRIYISGSFIYPGSIVVLIRGIDRTMISRQVLKETEEAKDFIEVILTAQPVDKKTIDPVNADKDIVNVKPEHLKYLFDVEERKQLIPMIKDKQISSALCGRLADAMGVSAQNFEALFFRSSITVTEKE